jgi:SAM-dependent methyltransferase
VTLSAVYGERLYAECPQCGALERHRLLSLVLDDVAKGFSFQGKAILHFAPEAFFRRRFMALTKNYRTSDLVMMGVDMRADLSDLAIDDSSVDVLFASYILQYIKDDLLAMREIRRVLRPGGFSVLPVTIVSDETVEYPEPNLDESGGHVRAPGMDYFDRFCEIFSRVDLYRSSSYSERFQTYVYEDRSQWPTKEMPLRRPSVGVRHEEIVPICWR